MMHLDETSGKIIGVPFIPTPNYDLRPAGIDIDMLVVHCINLPPGDFEKDHVVDFFLNQLDTSLHPFYESVKGLKVSAHCYIPRDGNLLQFVPLHARAWHAGVSQFQGRERCNDYSIGIELEGDEETPYTAAQYSCLSQLTQMLFEAYPNLTPDRVVGHSDIAPGRKTDPGPAFDWAYYRSLWQPRISQKGKGV